MNEKQNPDDIIENREPKKEIIEEDDISSELNESVDGGDFVGNYTLDENRLEDRGLLQENEYLSNLEFDGEYETVSYPLYAKDPKKYEGKALVVTDFMLDRGETNGFSVQMQKKFGWRKEEKYSSDLLKDYEKKHGDYEHPGDYFNERGAQARLASLVKNPKEQPITPSMVRSELLRRAENVDSYEEIKEALLSGRDEMISELFGKGNPLAAYKCFLDKDALKKNVYTFDRQRVQEMLDSFSNEKLAKEAKSIYKQNKAVDSFKYELQECLGVRLVDLPEDFTCGDVLDNARADVRPNEAQIDRLCNALITMKQLHNERGFFGMLRHPIDYFREWRYISRATDMMVNDFHVDEERLDAPPLDDGIFEEYEIRQAEPTDYVVPDITPNEIAEDKLPLTKEESDPFLENFDDLFELEGQEQKQIENPIVDNEMARGKT